MNWDFHQLFSSPLEFFAVVTGVICVFLITVSFSRKIGRLTFDHVWNWPIGVVSSMAFTVVFWKYQLYLNALLQALFYVPTGIYGWYVWLRGGEQKTRIKITRATPKLWAVTIALALLGTVVMWQVESNVVASQYPLWDAAVVALSLVAQMVMTRKVVEHWWFWISVDVIGVVLFWASGLQLTSVLYFVYGCICVRGLFTWRRMWRSQEAVEVPANPLVPTAVDPWGDWDGAPAQERS